MPFVLSLLMFGFVATSQENPYKAGPGHYPRFDSKQADPGLHFGVVPELPLPKTVLFSLGPDELLADAEAWKKLGIEAFFLTGVASEWSADVWAADGEPWTVGASDKTFQKVKQANELCRRIGAETFLTMPWSHTFDWFDDLAWQKIENNFRQFAMFARESGCTGIAIDIEYIGQQYHFHWPDYDFSRYTRPQLIAKVSARATQIARALYEAFPDAPLLTFPESAYDLGVRIQAAWIEEAARRDAPGGIHLCTEYTYRWPNPRFMFGIAWRSNQILQGLLSEQGKAYWMQRCSIAEGLWPFGIDPGGDVGYHGAAPTPDAFRQAYAASLMAGSRYNWIYSHDAREKMLGRDTRPLEGQAPITEYMPIIQAREVITDPAYVSAARDIRKMVLRDYSPELGLVIVPTLFGPREEMKLDLIPKSVYAPSLVAGIHDQVVAAGQRLFNGEEIDLAKEFAAQMRWNLIGPFNNKDMTGYATAYGPESAIALDGEYDGVGGKVRWQQYTAPGKSMIVDLAKVYQPSDQVCAYALCYAVCEKSNDVQLRVSGNDRWKLWVGGKIVYENATDGMVFLDRDIVPVSLPAGSTPILLKVCNNLRDWAFVFRITDGQGNPAPGVTLQLNP